MNGTPRRQYYRGGNLERAVTVADLRARTHKKMPRFVLEYLEGGAEDEATLERERSAFAKWRFMPRTLVDVTARSLACDMLGTPASMPLAVAPTGLNGIFRRGGDIALAQAAAQAGVPFVQSTMSNERIEEVARISELRHWFQLYVFGGDDIWQDLVARAQSAGCEALVLTTNSQIYGNREWDTRTRATRTRPSLATIIDAALRPSWLLSTLVSGMPVFRNIIDYVPEKERGFFESAFWVRDQMRLSLSWATVAEIRTRWRGPIVIKGLLNMEDVRRATDSGVDGVVLGGHGGRQLDWAVAPLDLLPEARTVAGDRIQIFVSGGIRRGTDILKAVALGANAVMAGRAPLYGLCAGGTEGAQRALDILRRETRDALGLLGMNRLDELHPGLLARSPFFERPWVGGASD